MILAGQAIQGIRKGLRRVRPRVEILEGRTLLSTAAGVLVRDGGSQGVAPVASPRRAAGARAAASGSPIVDQGQLPFQIQITPVAMANAPSLQSAVSAQADGKWLFLGGRTSGLH